MVQSQIACAICSVSFLRPFPPPLSCLDSSIHPSQQQRLQVNVRKLTLNFDVSSRRFRRRPPAADRPSRLRAERLCSLRDGRAPERALIICCPRCCLPAAKRSAASRVSQPSDPPRFFSSFLVFFFSTQLHPSSQT